MYRPQSLLSVAGIACTLLLLSVNPVHAQTIFTVNMDLSSLIGNANGPFSLDFQLTDGSGSNDGNNTATLTNFAFGTGSATGVSTTSGGAFGDLTSGITLTDSSFFNELYQPFIPGNFLSFQVALTSNADTGDTPDQFSFAILDSSLNEISTSGFGAFLVADISAPAPSVQTFAGSDSYASIAAPMVSGNTTAPEPGVVSLLLSGIGFAALLRRQQSQR